MRFRVGPGSSGYNYTSEFIDEDCVCQIASATTLSAGQPVWYNSTCVPGTPGADLVVPGPSGSASRLYGIYLGPDLASAATATSPTIQVRLRGYGTVLGQVTASTSSGSSAVNVGSTLIAAPNTAGLTGAYTGTAVIGQTVGIALSTGSASAVGSAIMAVGASASVYQKINAFIAII